MSANRSEFVAMAQAATNRFVDAVEAHGRGEAVDLEAAAEADTSTFNATEEAETLVRCGRILRESDPATYRLLRCALVALAAAASAPPEN